MKTGLRTLLLTLAGAAWTIALVQLAKGTPQHEVGRDDRAQRGGGPVPHGHGGGAPQPPSQSCAYSAPKSPEGAGFANGWLIALLLGGISIGAALASVWEDPTSWKTKMPPELIQVASVATAIYLVLLACAKHLDDGNNITALKQVIDVTLPAVIFGAVVMAVTKAESGNPVITGAMIAVVFVMYLLIRFAPRIMKKTS